MSVQACRNSLLGRGPSPVPTGEHAGLLLSCYLQSTGDQSKGKAALLKESVAALRQARTRTLYKFAYDRWVRETPGSSAELAVDGRLILGLGGESVLETGLTLHHTYGTPVIPGSALKGLSSHYCQAVWGPQNAGFNKGGEYYKLFFGATEDSGHMVFHDAWIKPESLIDDPKLGLLPDVMTPHHGDYYMADADDNERAPTDFDSPVPVQFLSVGGRFCFVVTCDVEGPDGEAWAGLALRLLTEALRDWGVGGKTSSAYGRME
jgi:CRISPR-associated protein Cmr6